MCIGNMLSRYQLMFSPWVNGFRAQFSMSSWSVCSYHTLLKAWMVYGKCTRQRTVGKGYIHWHSECSLSILMHLVHVLAASALLFCTGQQTNECGLTCFSNCTASKCAVNSGWNPWSESYSLPHCTMDTWSWSSNLPLWGSLILKQWEVWHD